MALVDNLEAMLARGQDSALLRYSLGGEYLKLDQAGKAAEHLRLAVAKDPKYSAAWKLLGKALADTARARPAPLRIPRPQLRACGNTPPP